MTLARRLALSGLTVLLVATSVGSLAYLGWGYWSYPDYWDITRFVSLQAVALAASVSATALWERAIRRTPPGAAGRALAFLERTGLAFTAVVLLLCNAGPARGLLHAIAMRVVLSGMALDLAPPPGS